MGNNPHPERNLTQEGRMKGGRNSGGNFKNHPERAKEAGRKGGSKSRKPKGDVNESEQAS